MEFEVYRDPEFMTPQRPKTEKLNSSLSSLSVSSCTTTSTLSSISSLSSYPSPSGTISSPSTLKRNRSRLSTGTEDEPGEAEEMVNPFDDAQINKMLNILDPPVTTMEGYFNNSSKPAPAIDSDGSSYLLLGNVTIFLLLMTFRPPRIASGQIPGCWGICSSVSG